MSEGMSAQAPPAPVVLDFDHVYELGRLSGEVRLLKWAVAAAFVALLGCMGVLYDAIRDIQVELVEIRKDISALKADVVVLKEDVAVLKEDVAVLKEDVAVLKEDVAVLKEDVAFLKEDVAVLKEDVAVLQEDVAVLKEDVARLDAMHSSSMEDAPGRLDASRARPDHVDPAGESAQSASASSRSGPRFGLGSVAPVQGFVRNAAERLSPSHTP